MKRFLALIAVMCLVLPCFAGTNIYNDGYTTIDSTGVIDVYAAKLPYKVIVTNNTLVASESGWTTVVDTLQGDASYTVTLPASAVGLAFTVTQSSGGTIYIDPAIADTIAYGEMPMDAGDKLQSGGSTGDSITLICPVANTWVPIAGHGNNWADAGTDGE